MSDQVPGASILDSALEGTIVGSFTWLGFKARKRMFDWSPLTTDLSGQLAVVTGATSGIGRAAASALMELGADVVVTSRSQERAEEAAAELNAANGPGRATGHSLDTGNFDSIEAFAATIMDGPAVDMLLNNAGALTNEYQTDERGMELTLSTHLVGPYLLTKLLRPHLSDGARVVFMSSGGMYTQGLDVDEIEMEESDYKGPTAYARAKRGQVEMVTHLGPLWAPQVIMHSMHPGWVATAGVDSGIPGFGKVMGPLLRTAEQGADTMVWLAATGGGSEPAGQFWLDREPRRTAYLPGTSADPASRQRLVDWLETQTTSVETTE